MSAKNLFYPKDTQFSQEEERVFAQEELICDVTEDILIAMEDRDVTKKKLAEELGTSAAHVSQLLSGNRNMTLRTLADIAHVLGLQAKVHFSPQEEAIFVKGKKQFCMFQYLEKSEPVRKSTNVISIQAWQKNSFTNVIDQPVVAAR